MANEEKIRVTTAIVKILVKDFVVSPEPTYGIDDGTDGEKGESDGGDASSSSEFEDDPEEEDGGDKLSDYPEESSPVDPKDDPAESPGDEVIEKIDKIAQESKTQLRRIEKSFHVEVIKLDEVDERKKIVNNIKPSIEDLHKHLLSVDISERSDTRKSLRKIELTNRFVNLLKQMRTVIPQRGRGKLSGGKIDVLRLHQVAIDNKVFSVRTIEGTGNNDRVEIVIMLDASSSMSRDYSSEGWSLYHTCLAVSRKIFMALIGANIPAKVFAHTSFYPENYPLLVKIADNFTKNIEEKFELASNLKLAENLDGIIIEELTTKHFSSDSRTQKILLVLSDGSPQSPNYGTGVGGPHTKSAIEVARKNGIKVYSLSLIKHIVEYNDNLYGEQYNINASENLDKEMVNLVMRLVRRK
jgi:hypothetical protein